MARREELRARAQALRHQPASAERIFNFATSGIANNVQAYAMIIGEAEKIIIASHINVRLGFSVPTVELSGTGDAYSIVAAFRYGFARSPTLGASPLDPNVPLLTSLTNSWRDYSGQVHWLRKGQTAVAGFQGVLLEHQIAGVTLEPMESFYFVVGMPQNVGWTVAGSRPARAVLTARWVEEEEVIGPTA